MKCQLIQPYFRTLSSEPSCSRLLRERSRQVGPSGRLSGAHSAARDTDITRARA